jgi:hypothetical protein
LAATDTGSLLPLSDLIDLTQFPLFEHLPIEDAADPTALFASIYCSDASTTIDDDDLIIATSLRFSKSLPALGLPGLESFRVSIGGDETQWGQAEALLTIGTDPSLELRDLSASLVVDPRILAQEDDRTKGAQLSISGALTLTPSEMRFEGFKDATLKKSYVAGTQLKISAGGVSADPGPGHGAILMRKATVELPTEWLTTDSGGPLEIAGEQVRIGPTGLSGEFRRASADPVSGTLFGFPFRLRDCRLVLQDSSIRAASLTADIHLSTFDKSSDPEDQIWVAIDVSFGPAGVSAALLPKAAQPGQGDDQTKDDAADDDEPSIFAIAVPNLFMLRVKSLRLKEEMTADSTKEWVLFLSGTLLPLLANADWPTLAFDEIGIGSKSGIILPEGAGIATTAPVVVDWEFVKLTVDAFRLGRPRGRPGDVEISISAAVKIVDGVPAGLSVDGLTATWEKQTGKVDVRFDGIGVEFGMPGAFQAELALSYSEAGHRFKGHGALDLEALDLSFDVVFEAGHEMVGQTDVNYLFLTAECEAFPGGIPIGTTGLSLYGISGLVAYNKALNVSDKLPPERRYFGLFKQPKVGLTDSTKWAVSDGAAALGVGAVIGTSDDGTIFHCKGMLLITVPDLALLLQASADIIERKPGLKDQKTGSLNALLTCLPGDQLLTFDLTGAWAKGDLVEVTGTAHAEFHFDDPLAFLLELGRNAPGQMIGARAFRANHKSWLLDGGFWQRLDRRGLKTGILTHFRQRYASGGFWAELSATVQGDMGLFWDNPQWEGNATFNGFAGLGCGGLSLGVSISADVSASIDKPTRLTIDARACITISIPFKSWDICLSYRFSFDNEQPPALTAPLLAVRAEPRLWSPPEDHLKADGTVDDGIFTLTSGTVPEVWPHSVITLEFAKPMTQESAPYSGYENVAPILIGDVSRYTAQYVLTELQLVCESDPKATPAVLGTWIKSPASRPGEAGKRVEPRPPNTCLQLLSSDRFGRRGSLSGGGAEDIALSYCDEDTATERVCVSLAGMQLGQGHLENGWHYSWLPNVEFPQGLRDNNWGLLYDPHDSVQIEVPSDVSEVEVELAKYTGQQPVVSKRESLKPQGGSIRLPRTWPEAAYMAVNLCYLRAKVSTPGNWEVIDRVGSSGIEEWSVRPDERLLRPGESYRLDMRTEGRLDRGTVQQLDNASFRFKVRGAPDYRHALANAIAGTYPNDGLRPVYRGYDFVVRFKEDVFPAIYKASGRPLAIRFVDSRGAPLRDAQGNEILSPVFQAGVTEPNPVERWWRQHYMRNPQKNCIEKPVLNEQGETELAVPIVSLPFAPLCRYTAQLLVAAQQGEPPILAEWSFTTSRFKTFSDQIAAAELWGGRGILMPAQPASDEFDAIVRACGLPLQQAITNLRLRPVLDAKGLIAFLLEASEPLDDESKRLTITVDHRATTLVANRDWTRIFVKLTPPGKDDWKPTAVDFNLSWKREPGGSPEMRRRVQGDAQPEPFAKRISLEFP